MIAYDENDARFNSEIAKNYLYVNLIAVNFGNRVK